MKTKKSSNSTKSPFLRTLGYLFAAAVILLTAYFGSKNKTAEKDGVPIMAAIAENNYSVSVDQLSQLYIVAEIADNVSLPSFSYLNMDYITASVQYTINQSTPAKIEKMNIVDTSSLAKGVIEYEVAAGESMESIAAAFGLTTDQIRWSNGLKTTDLSAGQTLYLPSVSGIVYTIKDGDTTASIAEKYGSSAAEIEDKNNLASRGVVSGTHIVIPGGIVPETERPEYVAPAPVTTTTTDTYYGYLYNTGSHPMPWGWCTWWAWQRRNELGRTLPGGLGNARNWAWQPANAGYAVDKTPEPGAVFVSTGGYYGHVGVVEAVNDDGTLSVSDMNYAGNFGRVTYRTVQYSEWAYWQFVH